ncbi:MAG: bifunctional 3,4-dihydroxy-2-butanone-4-phosphate synthase/GTP cyclohydrolase II [Neisseriaceae bacterium]
MIKLHFNTIEEAISDLKEGKIIVICDDENRENEGDFVTLAENVTPETINFMITHGKGLLCTPISQEIANKLDLNLMTAKNTDNFSTAFTISIDHKTNSTGISAKDRCDTIKEIIKQSSKPEDFRRPGHIFPLIAKKNGVIERPGHTEATIDLARLCGKTEAGLLCEIVNPDGKMARRDDLILIAQKFGLKIITIKDLIEYRKHHDKFIKLEATTSLPTKFGNFRAYGYSNVIDGTHITVIIKGDPKNFNIPFVRIHSECLTGDVFHSLRCDCGEQLEMSLNTIEQEGQGIIIYLEQEGRGIGLINKLKAYELQENGYDTFDANVKLGFAADLREYFIAAQILKDLGIIKIKLATNNPHKIEELERYGITIVDRIAVSTHPHKHNAQYLQTKIKKFGHII